MFVCLFVCFKLHLLLLFLSDHGLETVTFTLSYLYRVAQLLSKPPSPYAPPSPPVSKCSPLKRWCPICHMWAKRDHALLFSITEFSSCQLRWDRRRSRWVAVSTINQHEIFSFEYTHHLLLLSLLETPQKELGRLSEAFCNWDHVCALWHSSWWKIGACVCSGDMVYTLYGDWRGIWNYYHHNQEEIRERVGEWMKLYYM